MSQLSFNIRILVCGKRCIACQSMNESCVFTFIIFDHPSPFSIKKPPKVFTAYLQTQKTFFWLALALWLDFAATRTTLVFFSWVLAIKLVCLFEGTPSQWRESEYPLVWGIDGKCPLQGQFWIQNKHSFHLDRFKISKNELQNQAGLNLV